MSDIFVFLVTLFIVIRTFGYGIWTISSKNILGGIFIISISLLTVSLSAYLLFFDRT